MKKSIKLMGKLTFIFFVMTMGLFLAATSCNKVGGDQSNSGGEAVKVCAGSGGGTSTVTQPTTTRKMTLALDDGASAAYIKIVGNTVYYNAKGLADGSVAYAGETDADRGEADITTGNLSGFTVTYPRPAGGNNNEKGALAFINCHNIKVTDMAFDAFKAPDAGGKNLCPSQKESESIANSLKATGSTCSAITGAHGDNLVFMHELGPVFYNTDLSKARASLTCTFVAGYYSVAASDAKPIASADAVPNIPANSSLKCSISVINNKVHNGVDISAQEIDDNWVDTPGATKEVELYAVSVFTGGNTLGQIASRLGFTVDPAVTDINTAGNGLFEFKKPWSNTAFRKLLDHADSAWADLRFKVKIVTSTEFNKL